MTRRLAHARAGRPDKPPDSPQWKINPAATPADSDERGATSRSVLLVSADQGLRQRLSFSLAKLRWRVCEARGGAEAMKRLGEGAHAAILMDAWLPDLQAAEVAGHVRLLYPAMEVMSLDAGLADSRISQATVASGVNLARALRRNELLHAIREARESPVAYGSDTVRPAEAEPVKPAPRPQEATPIDRYLPDRVSAGQPSVLRAATGPRPAAGLEESLPELVGGSQAMREIGRLVRLVAPRSTTVLIEGETGTGKEVVARALHRLSPRAGKPFVILNCAAIPESLLEAELFGHTRGAFTGAVQSRTGRIEAANGGTLLLDEIGEMPLGMQAKMLRFLESGELQRVGENEMLRVDARLIAATHQPLEERSAEGRFRLDLYHRLAVFPIEVPPLRDRIEDLAELAEHFLERMGRESPRKRLSHEALAELHTHHWPGNVRELKHVLERAVILSGNRPEIAAGEVRYRRAARA